MKKVLLMITVIFFSYASRAEEKVTNLIMPVSYFVDHVAQLKLIRHNLDKYKTASIVGISGMGKTQIARMYAYENKEKYDIVWFFDSSLLLNEQFIKLAKQLNKVFKANVSEEPELSKNEVIQYLSSKERWLLVFDNLKVGENKRAQEFINWEHNGNVIFCSQEKETLSNIIQMAAFNSKDAITLAKNLLENNDENEIELLVKTFNGYPILMVQGAQLLNKIKGLNREGYKKMIYEAEDKIKINIKLAIKELKPSAVDLLYKIALINNQSFSKEFLTIISNNKDSISDDIYQLSKFTLLSNIDSDVNNPVYEMHDAIAQKIMEINGDKNNKRYLEEIITKLLNAVPKSVLKGRVFRNSKTMLENSEAIINNSEKYNVNIYKMMGLNSNLARHYNNSLDYYNAEKKIEWFNKNDQKEEFKLWLMDNNEKSMYAAYLSMIGHYYRHKDIDYDKAIGYFIKATKIYDDVEGYESFKFNVLAQLAVINATLGQVQASEQNILKLEAILKGGLIDKLDANFIYTVKAKLLSVQGKYPEALELVNKFVKVAVDNGLSLNDLFLTNSYLLRSEILNSLQEYQEAYMQVQDVYNMHKPIKKEDHLIFGRIYTQMARSKLGEGYYIEAWDYINKAVDIFLKHENENPKKTDCPEDPEAAASYVVQGDILFTQKELKRAIESYIKAEKIYFYLYRKNGKNIDHVSHLYSQAAKASCKAKDLYHYKNFGRSQIKLFGMSHPNTLSMLEYCKNSGLDLWSEDDQDL